MEPVKRAGAEAAEAVTRSSDDASAHVGEPSAVEAIWAAMMVPHHRTGIQMAELAATKAATEGLRQAAVHSKAEQERDLPRLEQIVRAAGKTAMSPEKQIERMNEQQMQLLRSMSGVDFDRHWITVVGGHHMSAIMMTDTAMVEHTNSEARKLQEELRGSQLEELGVLNGIQEHLGG